MGLVIGEWLLRDFLHFLQKDARDDNLEIGHECLISNPYLLTIHDHLPMQFDVKYLWNFMALLDNLKLNKNFVQCSEMDL
jgi:hypothetical protein